VLHVVGFETTGVVFGDLSFLDPDPLPGQEGLERGVRLEVRLLVREALRGSRYSAQPISVAEPIWRVDLLESVDGVPGSLDRAHHHPVIAGWEVGPRVFDAALSADPLGWVGARLSDLDRLVEQSGVDPARVDRGDAPRLRQAVPDILQALERLLDQVRGEPAPPVPVGAGELRRGWL